MGVMAIHPTLWVTRHMVTTVIAPMVWAIQFMEITVSQGTARVTRFTEIMGSARMGLGIQSMVLGRTE